MKQEFILIKEILEQQFNNEVYDFIEKFDVLEFYINSNLNLKIITFLYDNNNLKFTFLTDLTAVHYPENLDKEIEVVYHLHNLEKNLRLRIKSTIPISKPEIFTLTGLFAGANWMERETYDFFGVIFKGHPNLKRILNADEMDYFPLRKEYPLEDNTRIDKDDNMFGR